MTDAVQTTVQQTVQTVQSIPQDLEKATAYASTGQTLPLPSTRRHSFLHRGGLNEPVLFKQVQVDGEDRWPVCEPAPFGLVMFAMPTLLFAFLNWNLGEASFVYYVFSMGLWMGGLGQLIASMLEFNRKNIIAATGFGIFGVFYLGAGAMYYMGFVNPAILAGINPHYAVVSVLIVYVPMGFIAAALAIASWLARTPFSMILMGIYGDAALLFWFGAAGGWSPACAIISGVFSFITSLFGFAGAAIVLFGYARAIGAASDLAKQA